MQKKQYEVCAEVLKRLHEHRVLSHLVLTGSWCLMLYRTFFKNDALFSGLRTRDIDFLLPVPFDYDGNLDLSDLLQDLGFLTAFKGAKGYMQLVHPEVYLEFLVPMRGRETDKPYDVPRLGINAQRLRFMDIALMKTIQLQFEGIPVRLPHPACFALHKILVAPRRKEEKKKTRDIEIGVQLLECLSEGQMDTSISEVLGMFCASWRKALFKNLESAGYSDSAIYLRKLS